MNEPTPEQAKRLAAITNPRQRRALESAIARGEAIPEVAWTPVRPMTPEQEAIIDAAARELVRRFGQRAPDLIAGVEIEEEPPEATEPDFSSSTQPSLGPHDPR